MIGYDVFCYRCRSSANGVAATETDAREHVEAFKRDHLSSCGMGTSFSMSIYETMSLLGVVEPPEFPETR